MVKHYSGESIYFHGPERDGTGIEGAVNKAVAWILGRLKTKYRVEQWTGKRRVLAREGVEDSYVKALLKASAWRNNCFGTVQSKLDGPMTWNFSFPDQKPVNLIGHSRGGLAVIEVARRLKGIDKNLKVNFMGLFDAVDRYIPFDTDSIPSNVEHVYHAIRSEKVGSRWYFGNTGTKRENKNATRYTPKIFEATHGALGGDPVGGDRIYLTSRTTTIFSDQSDCKHVFSTGLTPSIFVGCIYEKERIGLKENREASIASVEWMIKNAETHGLVIEMPK